MSEYLFAYGTLQPKCAPATMAPLVAKMRAVGEGFVHGALYDLGGYPGAVPDAHAKSKIMGTVMELPGDENVLQQLDAYEGIDPGAPAASEYIRERQTVQMVAGETLECWFYRYLWKPDPARAITSGVWVKTVIRGQ
jgi:gamma-glutamylcyclotransferase (GGCT)/AIG2-like uncharacterized protein YtfP